MKIWLKLFILAAIINNALFVHDYENENSTSNPDETTQNLMSTITNEPESVDTTTTFDETTTKTANSDNLLDSQTANKITEITNFTYSTSEINAVSSIASPTKNNDLFTTTEKQNDFSDENSKEIKTTSEKVIPEISSTESVKLNAIFNSTEINNFTTEEITNNEFITANNNEKETTVTKIPETLTTKSLELITISNLLKNITNNKFITKNVNETETISERTTTQTTKLEIIPERSTTKTTESTTFTESSTIKTTTEMKSTMSVKPTTEIIPNSTIKSNTTQTNKFKIIPERPTTETTKSTTTFAENSTIKTTNELETPIPEKSTTSISDNTTIETTTGTGTNLTESKIPELELRFPEELKTETNDLKIIPENLTTKITEFEPIPERTTTEIYETTTEIETTFPENFTTETTKLEIISERSTTELVNTENSTLKPTTSKTKISVSSTIKTTTEIDTTIPEMSTTKAPERNTISKTSTTETTILDQLPEKDSNVISESLEIKTTTDAGATTLENSTIKTETTTSETLITETELISESSKIKTTETETTTLENSTTEKETTIPETSTMETKGLETSTMETTGLETNNGLEKSLIIETTTKEFFKHTAKNEKRNTLSSIIKNVTQYEKLKYSEIQKETKNNSFSNEENETDSNENSTETTEETITKKGKSTNVIEDLDSTTITTEEFKQIETTTDFRTTEKLVNDFYRNHYLRQGDPKKNLDEELNSTSTVSTSFSTLSEFESSSSSTTELSTTDEISTTTDKTNPTDEIESDKPPPIENPQTEKPSPSEGTTSTKKPSPTEGTTPTEKPSPSEGTTSTKKPSPSEGTTPTKTPSPTEGTTPTEEPPPINPPETEKPEQSCDGNVKVKDLRIIPSAFSIFLNWTDPLPEDNCNFQYVINWRLTSDKLTEDKIIVETEYTIPNLNACEDYSIFVTVLYLGSEAMNIPETFTQRTLEIIQPVENLKNNYNKEDNSLLISWDVPVRLQKCIKNYTFYSFKDGENSDSWDIFNNNITMRNIKNCVNNTYLISANSEHLKSANESTTYIELEVNGPPMYNEDATENEIHVDFVITKWTFGNFICIPESFEISCEYKNVKPFTVRGEMNIQKNELTAKLENVEPHTNYTCCGKIINKAGSSYCSEPGSFITESKPPLKPENLEVVEVDNDYLNIQWEPPKKWNGGRPQYEISIEYLGLLYKTPENCPQSNFEPFVHSINHPIKEYNFSTIIPASKYKISIKAESNGGMGEGIETEFILNEEIPEKPTKMQINLLTSKDKNYNTSLNLTWETPCEMHGISEGYHVELSGKRENIPPDYIEKNILPNEGKLNYYIFPGLKPDLKYEIKLQAKNQNYFSETTKATFESPAGIPGKVNNENIQAPNASAVEEPWNSAIVYIRNDIFDETMGEILYYSVIVATKKCEESPKNEYFSLDSWPAVSSDNSTCRNELRAYEATQQKWNPFKTTKIMNIKQLSASVYEFKLGEQENCSSVDCNRPLDANTEYAIKIRGFTKNGYTDTKLFYFETEDILSYVPVGLIVGLVVGILVIAFIIAGVLFYMRGKLNFKNWPRMDSASSISPAPQPVPIKKFGSHYEKMIENPGKIKNEFQLLSTIASDVTLSTKTALLPINKKKNRYINILPYDQTRVKLEDTNANSSDYINASFIKGYSGSNEYIATQGPTEATCPAFWQMIIEQNVKLIVMLTQFVEGGKDKCYKYFPDIKEEYDLLNDIKIQCVEEDLLTIYNRRVFRVQKGNSSKKVTHIQFTLWPDFGVPDEVHHMIDFCDIIREIKLKKPSIIVMHCSAGVGRTGTLIAVDILLQNIRDKRKVDIFGTVLNLRKQRMTMVQSERQYEFLYKSVYYVITNRVHVNSSKNNISLTQISESNML